MGQSDAEYGQDLLRAESRGPLRPELRLSLIHRRQVCISFVSQLPAKIVEPPLFDSSGDLLSSGDDLVVPTEHPLSRVGEQHTTDGCRWCNATEVYVVPFTWDGARHLQWNCRGCTRTWTVPDRRVSERRAISDHRAPIHSAEDRRRTFRRVHG